MMHGTSPARAPLHVLHVIDSLRPGGAEQLIVTTAKRLDPCEFRLSVIALQEPLDLREELQAAGVAVSCVGLRAPHDIVRGLGRLTSLVRQARPDIVHTHLLYANVYGRLAGAAARVPAIVTTLHHLDYTHWSSRRWRFTVRKWIDRASSRRLNAAFIAVSHAVRDDYVKHFGLREIDVIYNYLEPERFQQPTGDRDALRRRLGVPEDAVLLLHVARLDWEKGHRVLLDALSELCPRIRNLRVVLIGDGPQELALRAMAAERGLSGHVLFAGKRLDVPEWLQAADLFVFPSLAEGLGIALLEAMAAGCPIVASRVEGIAEVVEDGVDGLLVPPGDPEALARAMCRLVEDRALGATLAAAARRTIERRFSASVGVPQLAALYRRISQRESASHVAISTSVAEPSSV